MKKDTKVILIACVAVLIAIALFIKTAVLGSSSDDYEHICIKQPNNSIGHLYHRTNFLQKMGIAIILDSEGKPVKCEVEK